MIQIPFASSILNQWITGFKIIYVNVTFEVIIPSVISTH